MRIPIRQVRSLGEIRAGETLLLPDAESLLRDAKLADELRRHVSAGGRVLILHAGSQLPAVFPEQVRGFRTCPGEIAHMHIPESPVFCGLEPLDLAWFEMGEKRIPRACRGTYRLQPGRSDATILAEVVDIHGYLKTPEDLAAISGSPLIELRIGKGKILATEMILLDAAGDPIATRLLSNLLSALEQSPFS